jgi:hypothetical protein
LKHFRSRAREKEQHAASLGHYSSRMNGEEEQNALKIMSSASNDRETESERGARARVSERERDVTSVMCVSPSTRSRHHSLVCNETESRRLINFRKRESERLWSASEIVECIGSTLFAYTQPCVLGHTLSPTSPTEQLGSRV